MPFDDASFDVVAAAYLLHILDADQRARVLGELHRVLKASGRVASSRSRRRARGSARGSHHRSTPRPSAEGEPSPASSRSIPAPSSRDRDFTSPHIAGPDSATRLYACSPGAESSPSNAGRIPRSRRFNRMQTQGTANGGGSRWTPTRAQRLPDGTAPESIATGSWRIAEDRSRVGFRVRKMGLYYVKGVSGPSRDGLSSGPRAYRSAARRRSRPPRSPRESRLATGTCEAWTSSTWTVIH